ncbi:glycosyltransferase [Kosakonia cowanii]|uniref:glycosyltransferase n=1 Tax=Kosakonia cowanii TaxID=208223 RepID=UPI004063FC8F
MNQHALVSITIPAYKPDFFETALLSALNQSWPNCEIIICDDSRDDTIRLLTERYARQAAMPIRYFKNETQLGEENNVRRCIQEAQGKYIKFLYDDDIIYQECVTRLVTAMEASPANRLASCRRTRVDEAGNPLVDINATAFPFACDVVIDGADVVAFLGDNQINFIGEPSTVLCYRDDLLAYKDELFKLNGESMPFLADVALYVKLLRHGNLAFVAEPLAAFRISENQSSQWAREEKYREMINRTYTRFPQIIREQGWYKGSKEENSLVKVAPLNAPEKFQQQNIIHGMLHATHLSSRHYQSYQIQQWLQQRALPAQHRGYADAYAKARNIAQTLTVFILHADRDPAATQRTLDSINGYSGGYGLTVEAVTVGETAPHTAPESLAVVAPQGQMVQRINAFLSDHATEWVLFLDAGETLLSSGMLMFDLALDGAEQCDALYGDELYQHEGVIHSTAFRPDFNLDLLLSYPAEMARHWLFRTRTLRQLGGFNPHYAQAWQFEYIVRLIEQKGMSFAGHLPEPFLLGHLPEIVTRPEELTLLTHHLRQRGYAQGEVAVTGEGLYALRYHHQEQPLVSIIIPTKDQLRILSACVTTLLEKTRYPRYELLIVDNNSETAEALQWLEGISAIDPERIRVLRYPHPFNYSAINNMAAREARGDYLVLLNNDTAIIHPDWLDNLLNHGLRPEVGITGAKLLYPDGKIQHAGVVLGLRGPADHPYIGSENDRSGYMNRLRVDQNYNVVTAACLLIRKAVYEQVGGLDETQFTVSYNDVDLCLKVREAGYLTVWTPHAVVMHEGSVSQTHVDKTVQEKKRQRFMAEQDAMYRKWLPIIASDPAYNPHLSQNGAGFQFEVDRHNSWQPLHWKPIPRLVSFPLRSLPESQQRLDTPLSLMHEVGLVEGQINYHASTYADLARFAPDALIVHRQISDGTQEWLRRLPQGESLFKVFDLDGWLPAMPGNGAERSDSPQAVAAALRATLHHVDRLVVASDALAEQCAGLHRDIRVMPARLDPRQWSGLNSLRATHDKVRVGWIGSAVDVGDLEIIHKLVGQLADRVEWVFCGYCPPSLRPLMSEYHVAVQPAHFAQKLASLNLDLALLPLADNLWNRTLSPRRLLEYGACGVPVICSDTVATRDFAAVTRVGNKPKLWREAIENHLHDRTASAAQGDALKEQVLAQGFWNEETLLQQARIWLPDA